MPRTLLRIPMVQNLKSRASWRLKLRTLIAGVQRSSTSNGQIAPTIPHSSVADADDEEMTEGIPVVEVADKAAPAAGHSNSASVAANVQRPVQQSRQAPQGSLTDPVTLITVRIEHKEDMDIDASADRQVNRSSRQRDHAALLVQRSRRFR